MDITIEGFEDSTGNGKRFASLSSFPLVGIKFIQDFFDVLMLKISSLAMLLAIFLDVAVTDFDFLAIGLIQNSIDDPRIVQQ